MEGKPYEMKYTDSYGNVCTRFVDHLDVISKFFATSNTIDTHNQLRQDLLQLEKKLVTKKPYFCLTTTLLGINVIHFFWPTIIRSSIMHVVAATKKNHHSMFCWTSSISTPTEC
jgi:hypothetical protein